MMNLFVVTALSLLAASPNAARSTAIVGGQVWTADGRVIERGSVVFRGEKIIAVGGPDLAIPADAQRLDAKGKIVTPGFVDASSHLGLSEIELVDSTNEFKVGDASAIRAAFRIVDGLNPASIVFAVTRMEGVTSAVTRPDGGLISGQAAWIRLDGDTVSEIALEAPVAMHGMLNESARGFGGGTRAGAIRRLREAFEDARLLRTRRADFEGRRLRDLSASRLDLAALALVLDRKIPLVLRAHKASDIEAAVRLAREENVKLAIDGGTEAWKVAKLLAEANVPVILKPIANLPESFEKLGARLDNAALLRRAGVRIALTSDEVHNARTLRQEAGNAVAHGLSIADARAAVTTAPAEIFGVQDRVGGLKAGNLADLVIWDGDPFELSTRAERVWIGGKVIPMRSRQTELLDRYRTLPAR